MKLVVFGATGGAGRHLVDRALAAGHEVTAAARDPARISVRERLRGAAADVSDAAAVARAIEGQDAVLCAVGPSRGVAAGTIISGAARNILDGMRRDGVRRLVFTSGLMVGEARGASALQRAALAIFRRVNGALYRDKASARRSSTIARRAAPFASARIST